MTLTTGVWYHVAFTYDGSRQGAGLQLYVNGALSQTLTAGTGSIGAFRLGSVTSGSNSTLMYFDGFTSKRTVSPPIGPGP